MFLLYNPAIDILATNTLLCESCYLFKVVHGVYHTLHGFTPETEFWKLNQAITINLYANNAIEIAILLVYSR